MKWRDKYGMCCDCGIFTSLENMFMKDYKLTGICLCRKCAKKLCEEIQVYNIVRIVMFKDGEEKTE